MACMSARQCFHE